MVENYEEESFLKRLIILFIVIVFGLLSLIWFVYEVIDLVNQVYNTNINYLVLNRGVYGLLGCGLCFLTFSFIPIYQAVTKKEASKRIYDRLGKMLFVSLVLVITLPISMSIFIPLYAKKINYNKCEGASYPYGWPAYQEVYYTKTDDFCSELTQAMNASLKSGKKKKPAPSNIVLP